MVTVAIFVPLVCTCVTLASPTVSYVALPIRNCFITGIYHTSTGNVSSCIMSSSLSFISVYIPNSNGTR